jgi:hypothetical protein
VPTLSDADIWSSLWTHQGEELMSSWNPKALSPYVTNLEIWLLFGIGFALGKWGELVGTLEIFLALIVIVPAGYWWRGYCGLDQWPNPHGRFYRQWLGARDVGDYYPWLAERMGQRSPWKDWVEQERALR